MFLLGDSMIFSLQSVPEHLLKRFPCSSGVGSSIHSFHGGAGFAMRQLTELISLIHVIVCDDGDIDFPASKLPLPE